MKLFKPLFLITLLSLIIISNSCKVTYPNEKFMKGKWTPLKVEKYVEPGKAAKGDGSAPETTSNSTAKSIANTDSTSVRKAKNNNVIPPETLRENSIDRHMLAEQKSYLVINHDKKMVEKFYSGKTLKATWKMKKKGTQIVAKEIQSGKKLTMDILKINDTSAVVVGRMPYGCLKVTYHIDGK
jgi:hypothetical protein